MSKSNHTEAQMIGALKQLEAVRKADDVAREIGVSKHTIYAWKQKGWPGGLTPAMGAVRTALQGGEVPGIVALLLAIEDRSTDAEVTTSTAYVLAATVITHPIQP